MSRVQEIEKEIARWVLERDQKRWDDQMDRDAAAGKLDFLRQEARIEREEFPKTRL